MKNELEQIKILEFCKGIGELKNATIKTQNR